MAAASLFGGAAGSISPELRNRRRFLIFALSLITKLTDYMTRIFSIIIALCAVFTSMASAPRASHVVFIGLDGWGANTYPKANTPFIKKLAAEGAFSPAKRAVLESSSAINWASIFMGVGPEIHGYLTWGSTTPDMQQPAGTVTANGIFPTIFQLTRQALPQSHIAVFSEWDGIKHLVDTLSLDIYAVHNDSLLASVSSEYLVTNKPELMAVIFNSPDEEGHSQGWGSHAYYDMMTVLDGYIAEIFHGLERAGMLDDTVVIITGDHGGIGTRHGGTSADEVESPLIVWGKGVNSGTVITDMVVGYDVAATIAAVLGIDPPQCWRGRPIIFY